VLSNIPDLIKMMRFRKDRSKTVLLLTLLFAIATGWFSGCSENYVPKPRGYFRIDLPPHQYQMLDTIFPYKFPYSQYAEFTIFNKDSDWVNISYPKFKAVLHFSYKAINKKTNLRKLIDDSQAFVYKHTIKASAIDEQLFTDSIHSVYGLLFDIKGNAASNEQFYVTDSTRHFLRASLYFDVEPNYDSLAPVIAYIRQDLTVLIDSLEWK